ncbi:MAG TPA: hypothetical protein VMH81_38340 [Bryobacteraceae bacterium]|nr:hypothetical protein [Bryobacteraceae bacterium]
MASEPVPPTAPQSEAGPGEFTRMFNSPFPERSQPEEDWQRKPARMPGSDVFQPGLPTAANRAQQVEDKPQGEFTRFFKATPGPPPATAPREGSIDLNASPGAPQVSPIPQATRPSQSQGEFTRMFGKFGGAEPLPGSGSGSATGAFQAPILQPAGPSAGASPAPSASVPAVEAPPAEQGPSEYTRMIARPAMQPGAAGAAAPAAPGQSGGGGGGGSPIQVNVNAQAPQLPGVYPPQMPHIPQPQVQVPGVQVYGPQIPQPMMPAIPQPTIPQATITTKGSPMLERIIIFLVGLLCGVGLSLALGLLKK